jgi:putative ABC transport system permease protein
MISKEIIKYSIKNIWKRKGRSFLTIFSIFLGIATIFIFLSFGLGLYNYTQSFITESSADKITISPKGIGLSAFTDESRALTREDLRAIEKTSGVFEASGMVMKVVEIQQGKTKRYTFLTAFDPEVNLIEEFSGVGIIDGRELRKSDSGNVLLGYNFRLDNKVFPKALTLNDKINLNGKNLNIVGFYDSIGNPQDDSQIYVNLDYIDRLYPDSENNFGMIIARVDVNNIEKIIEDVEKNLRKSRGLEKGKEDFYVSSFQDLLETYTSALNIIIGFVVLIALISVIVSAVNTANTMITSVLERIREIGIIKSVGAKNSEVFKVFLFESSFLGFVAGIFGVLIGFIFVFIVGGILKGLGWGFLQPAYPWYLFLGCILFATLTGAISGSFPALQAAKIKPTEALREE